MTLNRPVSFDVAGPWSTRLEKALAEVFGPSRKAKLSNDVSLRRVVKDVLRPGDTFVGVDENGEEVVLPVTPELVKAAHDSVTLALSNGEQIFLTTTHGDRDTGEVPGDQNIRPIDKVALHDGRLWFSAYVPDDVAKQLTTSGTKVSPLLWPAWKTSTGDYPLMVRHIALTGEPRQTGQFPFLALSLSDGTDTPLKQRRRDMKNFRQVVDTINLLLKPFAFSLPPDMTEENLADRLTMLTQQIGPLLNTDGSEGPIFPTPDQLIPLANSAVLVSTGGKPMQASAAAEEIDDSDQPDWAKAIVKNMTALSNVVNGLVGQGVDDKKTKYLSVLNAAGDAGLAASEVDRYTKIGEVSGWNLSLLPEAVTATVPVGMSISQQFASADAPNLSDQNGTHKRVTEAEANDLAKDLAKYV